MKHLATNINPTSMSAPLILVFLLVVPLRALMMGILLQMQLHRAGVRLRMRHLTHLHIKISYVALKPAIV